MTAVAISPTEILVTWDIVPPIDQNGVIIRYGLSWNFVRPGSGRHSFFTNVYGQRRTLTSLYANVEYLLNVRAYTMGIVRGGPLSGGVVAQTPEDGKLIILPESVFLLILFNFM